MITAKEALQRTIEHREIFYDEMVFLMRQIIQGEISPLMSAAILTGLRVKKETVDEITAAAFVMRELSTKVPIADPQGLLDIVGTGGDGSQTFNISTTSMIVCAALGVKVAKHGNRAASSKCGSADVLEALGININLTPQQIGKCIDEVGIGFMFAPNHHSAMKNVAPIRKEMGIKTVFNILGPLTNPAGATHTLMGVFHPDLVGIQVRVMQKLGAKRVMVVYGLDGIDEISLGASTMVAELKDGKINEYQIHPEDFGINMSHTRNLQVNNINQSKEKVLSVLNNYESPALDVVLLNAGAAIYCAGRAENISDGINLARQTISDGLAMAKLQELIKYTNKLSN